MKVGLALGGGGAKGTYQLGVLKALEEYGLLHNINYISGTSIGAINTLLLMNYNNVDKMIETWGSITNKHVFEKFNYFSRSLFDLKPLFKKVNQNIDLDKIRNSNYQGYITTTKLLNNDFKLINLRKSNLKKEVYNLNTFIKPLEATLASASIPLVFMPTHLNGETHVDGGLVDNYTVDILIDKGCDIIIFVPLDVFYDLDDYDLNDKLLINLSPTLIFSKLRTIDLLQAVNFDQEKLDHKFKYGYLFTKKMIKRLIKDGIIVDNKFVKTNKVYQIDKEYEERLFKKLK